MVTVLIVDDNLDRMREITAFINSETVIVEYTTTKNEALNKLEQKQYDLVIVDIMLPENVSALNPNKNAGIELIEDIERRKRIYPPLSILGVTSDTETYEECKAFFEKRLIPILVWKLNDNSWKTKIENKLIYLDLLKTKDVTPKVDIAIITAVQDEYDAVKGCFDSWDKVNLSNDPATYFITSNHTKSGKKQKIILAMLPEMGMTAASNTTTKIIVQFKPSKIFMVGICGGIRGEVSLGDIIVATQTWDYGSGKIKPKEAHEAAYYKFEASPTQIQLHPNLIDKLKYSTDSILKNLTEKWNKLNPKRQINPQLIFSPMPSGSSVISDTALFTEIIKPQHRKCKGIDMETYGVYYAAKNSCVNQLDFLSVKSVSDYADIEKNDEYHEACCYMSANFLVECLQNDIL